MSRVTTKPVIQFNIMSLTLSDFVQQVLIVGMVNPINQTFIINLRKEGTNLTKKGEPYANFKSIYHRDPYVDYHSLKRERK